MPRAGKASVPSTRRHRGAAQGKTKQMNFKSCFSLQFNVGSGHLGAELQGGTRRWLRSCSSAGGSDQPQAAQSHQKSPGGTVPMAEQPTAAKPGRRRLRSPENTDVRDLLLRRHPELHELPPGSLRFLLHPSSPQLKPAPLQVPLHTTHPCRAAGLLKLRVGTQKLKIKTRKLSAPGGFSPVSPQHLCSGGAAARPRGAAPEQPRSAGQSSRICLEDAKGFMEFSSAAL